MGACGIVLVWALELPLFVQVAGTVLGLLVVTVGYTYPVVLYLKRAALANPANPQSWRPTLHLMLLAACLSGVALLGTWGTIQQGPSWAAEMAPEIPTARSDIQILSSLGAILGTIIAALVAEWLGRRITYSLLCIGSLIIIPTLFLGTSPRDPVYVYFPIVFLSGAITASFYGWLPLYLPEIFPTAVRTTGQGFGFNFGRVIAAIGVLQLGNLKELVKPYGWGLGHVCSMLATVYIVGLILIWAAPETKGKPLPE